MKPDKVLIPVGEHSAWCRAIAIKNDMPTGVTKELQIQGYKGSLGEYLIILLLQGYIIRMEQEEMVAIEALHKDFIMKELGGKDES